MLKNHLLVALRTLRRERGYAALNVVGLAVGLACCALIVLYVRDELRYDRHHEHADRVVRVTRPTAEGSHWAATGPPVGPALEAAFPEVEAVARIFDFGSSTVLSVEGREERFEAPGGVYADAAVFEVFTLPLLRGDPATALDRPGSVVLSASMAERLFGEADPVGKTLGFQGPADLTVTGVMADLPPTTHLPFEYAISMATFYAEEETDWLDEARTWAGFYTYLLLRRPEDAAALAAKLPGFVDTFFAGDYDGRPSTQTELRLQPITDIHLHSKLEKEYAPNGDVLYVWVFALVALFVLVIAAVNFINLTTARSGHRLREVGVRKAMGSTRGQLARQFLVESVLTSGLALALAVALVAVALPLLNGLTGKAFTPADAYAPAALLGLGALALGTGLLAGLYPALYMAGFGAVRALRNDPTGRQPALLRRGLVAFQFALSIFMLASTAVVYTQLDYVRSKALGFDKER
ncbi:MAG: ABC transporter permease, partial [Rhodothermales bacterium]|nr:ABC transporter permease [Rhodothermales bacterium]